MARPPHGPIDVVLVGSGERAEAWGAALDGAPGVGALLRHRGRGLSPASLAPAARVAAALPPRAGLALARTLAAQGRTGLVEAPLDLALADATLPEGSAAVKVAHGWCTLARRAGMGARAKGARRARVEIRGLPEAPGRDLGECTWHALALVRALFPEARVLAAEHDGTGARIMLGPPEIALSVQPGSPRLRVELEAGHTHLWRIDGQTETLEVMGGACRARPAWSGAVRGVAALGGDGDDLFAAREVAIGLREVQRRIGPGTNLRALDASARALAKAPEDVLGALGLQGTLPPLGDAPTLEVQLPPEPLELWSFRAGQKPVAFLTVAPDEEARTLAPFGDVHVVRRERRVAIGPQDAWDDRRDRGAPRIELYVSKERGLAERAAQLQAEGDPSAGVHELGALMGYPPCCVEAFAALPDRSNNTAHRYAAAGRTGAGPWPAPLSNLFVVLLPWFVCRYDCAASGQRAEGALAALEAAHPGARARLEAALGRPVLYFTHDHQVVLDGEALQDGAALRVRYRTAARPSGTARLGALGGVVAAGDELALDHERLVVWRQGVELASLARTDPGLGIVAPFAPR